MVEIPLHFTVMGWFTMALTRCLGHVFDHVQGFGGEFASGICNAKLKFIFYDLLSLYFLRLVESERF